MPDTSFVSSVPNIRPLPNKPLIEAIFELRWQLPPGRIDTNYPLFVGRLHDRVESTYSVHKPLPTPEIPQEIAGNVVQHQFRVGNDRWPLIQVGPGIVTLNDTEGYIWQDFGQRAKSLVSAIFQAYPKPNELRVASLLLRYLDAFEFDNEDMLKYLSDKLKVDVAFPSQLFEGVQVMRQPQDLSLLAAFSTEKPKGTITIKFTSGKHAGKPSLIMDTAVRSESPDLPEMPNEFEGWVEAAHKLTDDWFFKFIEGELDRRFSGEL